MPAAIPLIIGAVTAGIGTYQAVNQPGAPKPTVDPASASNQVAEKQSFLQAAPSVQERLGGSVAPDFFASEVARVSGNPADQNLAQQVLSQYLGLGSTSQNQALSSGIGTGQQNNFSPFAGSQPQTQPQQGQPNFFEGLLGGGLNLGEGDRGFSGGYA